MRPFLASFPSSNDLQAAPTGFSATPEEVLERVRAYIETNKAGVTKLGWNGIGKSTGLMKGDDGLRWVPTLDLKGTVEKVYEEIFGSREDAKAAAASNKAKKVRFIIAERTRARLIASRARSGA